MFINWFCDFLSSIKIIKLTNKLKTDHPCYLKLWLNVFIYYYLSINAKENFIKKGLKQIKYMFVS